MAHRENTGEGDAHHAQGPSKPYYGNRHGDTEELASKMVFIQNKRFYLDVKENARGRFIKIAEVTPGGRKNRLTLSMPVANEFRNVLGDFIEHYAGLGPTNPDAPPEDRRVSLKTDRIIRENKRYFLDLKENQRGRFLRVRQQQAYNFNQDGRPMNPPQIALPAQGMVEFRDALTGLIDEYGQDTINQPELPSSHVIGNRRTKQFFLDVGQNQRGVFLRMTEQTRYYRSAVTIPEEHWDELADYLKTTLTQMDDYYEQLKDRAAKPEDNTKDTAAAAAAAVVAEAPEADEEVSDGRRRTDDYDDREEEEQKQDE